jgi:hypothetical protein
MRKSFNVLSFEFFSDIGGTVGLMLGLSAASVISILETLFGYMWHKGKRVSYNDSPLWFKLFKAVRESLIRERDEANAEAETKIECLNTL